MKGFGTTCIHAGFEAEQHHSHITPIYASSTYLLGDTERATELFTGQQQGFVYGRFGSPTTQQIENKIAALETFGLHDEQGNPMQAKAILHASGMAAISTLILSHVQAGQTILSHYSLYGGTQEYIDKILPGCGIQHLLIDLNNQTLLEKTLQENPSVAMVYIETPANPTLQCIDIAMVTTIAHQMGKIVAVDNTFCTPYVQQPFAFGVDYIIHSTTKFLNGHGTAIGGILIGRHTDVMQTKITKHHRLLGANSNSFDAFLLNNGLKTLAIRMQQHCANAQQVAEFLLHHPAVAQVNYVGLSSHPHAAIARKQMKNGGALLSFELKGGLTAGKLLINHLQLCTHAVSLGTCDTLVSHPASTTHVGVSESVRLQSGITDGLIRMSVGIEDIDDILFDLQQALNYC